MNKKIPYPVLFLTWFNKISRVPYPGLGSDEDGGEHARKEFVDGASKGSLYIFDL